MVGQVSRWSSEQGELQLVAAFHLQKVCSKSETNKSEQSAKTEKAESTNERSRETRKEIIIEQVAAAGDLSRFVCGHGGHLHNRNDHFSQ
ncbi:hypothetical protein BKA93DRAFT_812893 [Sparassis latifolia]